MNLDFRKLGFNDQIRALNNLYRIEHKSNGYLAYLIANEKYDVYTWFSFSKAVEGAEYWFNLKDEVNEKV